ncbi:hypothetical protein [Spirosoma sp.]|uniref:hypothetical protein n=1 Tax=Spirosoma sp. TaxID=1899569 RepID=UPI0026229DD3|nr:hypothetical protein [Spirosoma sp.]MCX6214230.1 hypothetical protein [Spirosoma sp.]
MIKEFLRYALLNRPDGGKIGGVHKALYFYLFDKGKYEKALDEALFLPNRSI